MRLGRRIQAYQDGRDDARTGRDPRRPSARSRFFHAVYLDGFRDESRRMTRERRLAQLEMFSIDEARP